MGPGGEKMLAEGYVKYRSTPTCSIENPADKKLNLLYDKGWCVYEGRSFAFPHPHRHFTYDEFLDMIISDSEFSKIFFDDVKNKTV